MSKVGASMSAMKRKGKKMPREFEGKKSAGFMSKEHEADVNYAIQINRWLLKLLGFWPKSLDAKNLLLRSVASVIELSCIRLLAIVLVSGSLYTFLKEKDTAIRLQLIGVMSFCVMNIVKYGALRNERSEIGQCIDDLIADWARIIDTDERTIMHDYAASGRYGTTLCTCFSYAGSFFYVGIVPVLTGKIVIPDTNLTIRPLPLPGYFVLFDSQISPAYEIVYALQCCCSFVMHTTAAASCSLAVIFVMHACGQLEIVNLWLNRFVDENTEYFTGCEFDCSLGAIIEQHVRTLSFISRTEEILREICLIDLLGSTLNLCLLGFDVLTISLFGLKKQWEHSGPVAIFTFIVLIVSFLINIFSFCYMGEILTEKCRKVGEKTYMIDWHKLPSKTALGLTLTIATSDRPITITAGKLTNLSLTTFFTVVKTSIGYLNMLRTFAA